MGAAWIQTKGLNPESWHMARVKNWPSLTKAETIAIATLLFTVLFNNRVTINTNSQTYIDAFKRLKRTFGKQIQSPKSYSWKSFWKNTVAKESMIFFKDCRKRSFLLKLIYNELLTLDKLNIRQSDLYN